ncbi:MAG TPA: hypothetical protein VE955_12730 [Candidatus Dormibacteraeota bacterium]|nr:hypothetical protein [Candidatus Dormibacteraeota bacterium]
MKFTSIPVALLTLILLIAVPVGGAPALQTGSSATYNLSLSISLPPPMCEGTSSSSSAIIYCPMIVAIPLDFDVNGTLSWTAIDVNSTTAVLNVTRLVTTSSWNNLTGASFRNSHSFIESIDLATRVASIMPFLAPELDQALQTAQSGASTGIPTSLDWASAVSMVDSSIEAQHPIHTMWWVNGPLQVNDTVPVLVFPTNVTGSTSIDVANLGARDAWTLSYNITLPRPISAQSTTGYAVPAGDNMLATFTFNYDKQSDLLLSADARVHLGLVEEIPQQTSQCLSPSAPTNCTASTSFIPVQYGVGLEASLTLANTNLNLQQHLGTTASSSDVTGSNSGSNAGTNTGSGTTSGNNPGSTGTGQNSGSSDGSNSGTTPQTVAANPPASMIPWIYWVIGIVTIVIVVTGLWLARQRKHRANA